MPYRTNLLSPLLFVALAVAASGGPSTLVSGAYQNQEFGYSFSVPESWTLTQRVATNAFFHDSQGRGCLRILTNEEAMLRGGFYSFAGDQGEVPVEGALPAKLSHRATERKGRSGGYWSADFGVPGVKLRTVIALDFGDGSHYPDPASARAGLDSVLATLKVDTEVYTKAAAAAMAHSEAVASSIANQRKEAAARRFAKIKAAGGPFQLNKAVELEGTRKVTIDELGVSFDLPGGSYQLGPSHGGAVGILYQGFQGAPENFRPLVAELSVRRGRTYSGQEAQDGVLASAVGKERGFHEKLLIDGMTGYLMEPKPLNSFDHPSLYLKFLSDSRRVSLDFVVHLRPESHVLAGRLPTIGRACGESLLRLIAKTFRVVDPSKLR